MKRPSLEQDYYESIDRPNVELVNLKKTPIKDIPAEGIVADELRKSDIIILATGYDAMTGSLIDLEINDKHGRLLQKKWQDGVETYLGLMIESMPNMFIVYSLQAPTALYNRSQIDWIVEVLQRMKKEGIKSIDQQQEFAVK